MPTDNKQSSSNNQNTQTVNPAVDDMPPVVMNDDQPPVVMEETTPPMLSTTDLPLANPAPVVNGQPDGQSNDIPSVIDDKQPIDSGSAAPSDDIVMAPVITTQKKKFAGGKVIATILGLFLLVGGLGAGIVLVRQNQNIAEKAAILECFPAGTKITIADGNTKNIEDFNSGDLVLSENIENGQKVTSKTSKLWNLYSFDMCSLSFEDGDILKLTSPHPLYTKEGWKAINEVSGRKHNPELTINKLSTNDYIKKLDGSWSKVTDISCKYGLFKVYNLAVDTTNTYFAQNYLVHNKKVVDNPKQTIILDDNGDVLRRIDKDTGIELENNTNNYNNPSSINYNTDINNCGGSGIVCNGVKSTCYQGDCVYIQGQTSGTVSGSCNTTYISGTVGAGDGVGSGVSGTFQCAGGAEANANGCNDGQISNDFNPSTDCFCGTIQQDYHDGTFVTFYGNNCAGGGGGGGGGGGTPPSESISAQCQNVKAYSTNNWTLLTPAVLSTLKTGDSVNFCVTGSATGGSFDKAKFTINGVVQAETTTIRPSSTDFCQLYVIPAGVTTFNVSAQINHVTLGWK